MILLSQQCKCGAQVLGQGSFTCKHSSLHLMSMLKLALLKVWKLQASPLLWLSFQGGIGQEGIWASGYLPT